MKRTCFEKNTNTDEQNSCEFHLVVKLLKEQILDPKENKIVKRFVRMKSLSLISIVAIILLTSCNTTKVKNETVQNFESNSNGKGSVFEIKFNKGNEFNYPTFVFWVEDLEGNFLETLFVTRSLATGTYQYATLSPGIWNSNSGEAKRPATLPYWLHKRGVVASDGLHLPTSDKPIPDAYTGATPKTNFVLKAKTDNRLPKKFRLLMEINQPWDWNEYWNNSIYLNDENYKTSCQPALVYAVTIDAGSTVEEYYLNPIGHSHYAGSNGMLYTDLTTITTAKNITKSVIIKLKNQ